MFESIQQLEQEIESFRQNILASSALIDSLENIAAASKQQSADFKEASSKLLAKMDQNSKAALMETVEQIKTTQQLYMVKLDALIASAETLRAENQTTSQVFSNKCDQTIASIQSMVDSLNAENKAQLDALMTSAETLRAESQATSQVFSNKCDQTITSIQSVVDSLSAKNKAHLDSVAEQINRVQAGYINALQTTETSFRECSANLTQKYQKFLSKLEETNMDQIYQTCFEMKKSFETKLMIAIAGIGVTAIVAIISIFVK